MKSVSKPFSLSGVVAAGFLALGFAFGANAAPITGDPVGNDFGWEPNSTNALNFESQVPGREGQDAPHVLLNSTGVGFVTLDFFNETNSLAFFEVRIDGQQTGTTEHPVVNGDTIHTDGVALDNRSSADPQVSFLEETFNVMKYVDIRLALGGERDWDFDWVRFNAEEAEPVPAPATLGLMAAGLIAIGVLRRRRNG